MKSRHDRRGVRRAARAGAPAVPGWLQDNTVDCACSTPFGPDETLQRGTIDLTTSIACRRCFVPLGLHNVRLPRGDPNQPWPRYRTERPPPPLRSPAFAQILDHESGLGLSIDSVAAADSDWAKLKYGAKRGVPCLLYRRVVGEVGCATPSEHLHITCMCVERPRACVWALFHGRSFTGALRRALAGGPATARTADRGLSIGTAATSSTPVETR